MHLSVDQPRGRDKYKQLYPGEQNSEQIQASAPATTTMEMLSFLLAGTMVAGRDPQ